MKILTADEFRKLTDADPAYALNLTEPTFIKGYCDMRHSKITHLSHFLQFCGELDPHNLDGQDLQQCVAGFEFTEHITTLRGTFHGHISCESSTIQEIDPDPKTGLNITRTDLSGNAANFAYCKIDVAQGIYPGGVSYYGSTIKRIGMLEVTQPDNSGDAGCFRDCLELDEARGKFNGCADFARSSVKKATRELEVLQPNQAGEALVFESCHYLETVDLKAPGHVDLWDTTVKEAYLEIEGCNEENESADLSECLNLVKITGTFSHSVDLGQTSVENINPREFKIKNPHKDGMFCGLMVTPMFEKKPIEAGMIMFGTKTIKELEDKLNTKESPGWNPVKIALMQRRIALKAMKVPTNGGMEI